MPGVVRAMEIMVIYGYFVEWIPATVKLAKGTLLPTLSGRVLGVRRSDIAVV